MNSIKNCPLANFGGQFEEELLGHCTVSWDGGYLPWREALWQARNSQPWDPKYPSNTFLRAVLAELKRKGFSFEAYTAVGTALDRIHGIDGYFFLEGVIVTVDASLRSKVSYKADLLLGEEDAEQPARFANRVLEAYAFKRAARLERDHALRH